MNCPYCEKEMQSVEMGQVGFLEDCFSENFKNSIKIEIENFHLYSCLDCGINVFDEEELEKIKQKVSEMLSEHHTKPKMWNTKVADIIFNKKIPKKMEEKECLQCGEIKPIAYFPFENIPLCGKCEENCDSKILLNKLKKMLENQLKEV